jgi:hypothetical protein
MQSFEIDDSDLKTIHELRNTQAGMRQLISSGKYKEYMGRRRNLDAAPFIAWDGEGYTDSQGIHHYMLMMNSTGQYINDPDLRTETCFNFLLRAKRELGKAVHIIFGGNYDATMIFKSMIQTSLPESLYQVLLDTNKVEWYFPGDEFAPSNYYKIEYIPFKWLQISGFDYHSMKHTTIKIYDIMTFFQMSAIKAWESRDIEVPEVIKSGKAARGNFTFEDIEDVRVYCHMELEMYVMLADKLRDEFTEAGINVRQWHGPGAVAGAIFKQYGIKEHMQEPPTLEIERAVQHAYFGGRFEQFKAGHHDGKVYVYDIRSAYPYQIQNLPSLANAQWEPSDGSDFDPDAYGLWLCEYDGGNAGYLSPHPLPWRSRNGNVGFPANNSYVWCWNTEARFATKIHHGYKLGIQSNEKPFGFVGEMYTKRAEWKALGLGGEKALKLGMNSLYGKMAQTVSGDPTSRPGWHQLAWAGMITSGARAQLWQAISQAPDKIIAVETDSVASMVPLDLPLSDKLGDWELTVYEDMTYVQSGIYFCNGESVASNKARTRGIDVREISRDTILQYMRGLDLSKFAEEQPGLLLASSTFVGITSRRKDSYGLWEDSTKLLKVAGGKRQHHDNFCAACSLRPKKKHTMADTMHDLSANMLWGIEPSHRHKLPWLDGEQGAGDATPIDTEAIQEFDVPRRMGNK